MTINRSFVYSSAALDYGAIKILDYYYLAAFICPRDAISL